MSWDSYRKLDDDREVNTNRTDFEWEEQNVPLLHSGFLETTLDAKPKCRLVLSVMFTRQKYVVKLTDRVSHKVAWIDNPNLASLFEFLEDKVKTGDVLWETEDWQRGKGNSFS